MPKSTICAVEGCHKPPRTRGLCNAHHQRLLKHGDPLVCKNTEYGKPLAFFKEHVLTHDKDECLIWPFSRTTAGYGSMAFGGKNQYIHRLVCLTVHGQAPSDKHYACHRCGHGGQGCVAPQHIYWGTPRQNSNDARQHGTTPKGVCHYNAKLTEADVRYIREMRGVMLQRELADLFGISRNSVTNIQLRKEWKWLD